VRGKKRNNITTWNRGKHRRTKVKYNQNKKKVITTETRKEEERHLDRCSLSAVGHAY
jgi:hypothetical protein